MGRIWRAMRQLVGRRVREIVKETVGETHVEALHRLAASGRVTVGRHACPTPGTTPRIRTYFGDDKTSLHIGAYSILSDESLFLLGGEHHTEWVTTNGLRTLFELPGAYEDGHPHSRGDIVVGKDVWVAVGAIVLSGVTIGNGAVVGAGAVVTRDVRPFAIVAGNPAVEIRRRFTDEQIERLERIAWWDWPDEKVIKYVDLLCSERIDEFLDAAEGDG
jgi:acetyltransferase-like isoleucine patch superfamily enzyme